MSIPTLWENKKNASHSLSDIISSRMFERLGVSFILMLLEAYLRMVEDNVGGGWGGGVVRCERVRGALQYSKKKQNKTEIV